MKRTVLTLGAVILLLATGVGCGLTAKQKMALADFSRSAATVGEATSMEMQVFREKGIQANTQILLLKGEPKVEGLPTLASLDRGYELGRVQPIIRAAQALAAYGKTMAALTNDTQTDELKKASTDLVQSIGQLPEARGHLGQEQLDAFGTIVQDIGSLWVEHKRKQALVMLVDRFGPAVDKLCDRLIQDFSSGPTQARGWVYLQLQLSNDLLEGSAYYYFRSSSTYGERQAALNAYLLTADLRAHRDEVCSRISAAAAAMKKANATLMLSIHDDRPASEDLKALGERAKSLKSAMDILVHH
jgi:hypothetical protein